MQHYAAYFCEWVDGTVIQMSPVPIRHDKIQRYLSTLLSAYLELRPVGELVEAPFVMNLANSAREPDIQIILNENPHTRTDTYMDGAADIVIEIVSAESIKRDYGEKFHEYEQGGVREYWIIDPLKQHCRFYHQRDAAYHLQAVTNLYETPLLPALELELAPLWQPALPGPVAIAAMVQKMLAKGS